MTTECQQVPDRGALLLEALEHARADDDAGDRGVTGGEALGNRHDVGDDPEMLACEEFPGASEAVDDLIHDQEDAVSVADLAHHLPIAWRRNMVTVRGRDRFSDDSGDRLRTLIHDLLLQ